MRRIDLSKYKVRLGAGINQSEEAEYDVQNSLIEVLLSSHLNLPARELLDRDDLARKIRDCADGAILLEEGDWNKLAQSLDGIPGLGRTDVEFIRRILEAPQVEVEEKK